MNKYIAILSFLAIFMTACSDPVSIIHESSENSESSSHLNHCIQQSPCELAPQINVWLSHEIVEPETPFNIYISAKNLTVNHAHIEGDEMNMGKIPLFFSPHENEQLYIAEGMVGICIDKDMGWNIKMSVHHDGKAYMLSLPFKPNY